MVVLFGLCVSGRRDGISFEGGVGRSSSSSSSHWSAQVLVVFFCSFSFLLWVLEVVFPLTVLLCSIRISSNSLFVRWGSVSSRFLCWRSFSSCSLDKKMDVPLLSLFLLSLDLFGRRVWLEGALLFV